MKTFENGLSSSLCTELLDWAQTYIYAKPNVHPLGYPNPVETKTNLSWPEHIIKDSKPVIIYTVHQLIEQKIKKELFDLKVIEDINKPMYAMVYVWTPGSYIPLHEDGLADVHRKVFTAYLNKEWSVENGGLFNYLDKNDNTWKVLIPHQGFLVYNDQNEKHFTTPVNQGHLRFSLQIFANV